MARAIRESLRSGGWSVPAGDHLAAGRSVPCSVAGSPRTERPRVARPTCVAVGDYGSRCSSGTGSPRPGWPACPPAKDRRRHLDVLPGVDGRRPGSRRRGRRTGLAAQPELLPTGVGRRGGPAGGTPAADHPVTWAVRHLTEAGVGDSAALPAPGAAVHLPRPGSDPTPDVGRLGGSRPAVCHHPAGLLFGDRGRDRPAGRLPRLEVIRLAGRTGVTDAGLAGWRRPSPDDASAVLSPDGPVTGTGLAHLTEHPARHCQPGELLHSHRRRPGPCLECRWPPHRCPVRHPGAEAGLAALTGLPALSVLVMSQCGVGDGHLERVAGLRGLTALDLSYNSG